MKLSKSFTLIELLIVIVIISILANSLIPKIKGIQNKAKYTRVEKDFQDFRGAVLMAHTRMGKPLIEITGAGYTAGACTTPGYIPYPNHRNLPYDDYCRARFRISLEKIALAAGMETGALAHMELDPRGSPYLLDENESEGSASNCNKDYLRSVGPDGVKYTSDDRNINLNHIYCPGAY